MHEKTEIFPCIKKCREYSKNLSEKKSKINYFNSRGNYSRFSKKLQYVLQKNLEKDELFRKKPYYRGIKGD
jgi:hypothetical protein